MSKHCWQDPLVELGGEPKVLQCTKCAKRELATIIMRTKSSKKECPGLKRSFRRAMRRYARIQTLKERNHGRAEIQ